MNPETKPGGEVTPSDIKPDTLMDDAQCLTGPGLYSVLSGLMIATTLISLDSSIIATAIPAITSQFNTATDIGWYGAAYPLTMCALQPLGGKLSTIFSLRWTYLVFFGVFLLGSLLCGSANSSTMFIVGRAVAGIGGSGVVPCGLSVIALVTPTAQRPLFTGLIMSLYFVGTVIAPIIGGAFTTRVSWRWCFYINLPAGAVTVATLLFFFHPPLNNKKADAREKTIIQRILQLDLIGCVLFVSSIVMLFIALQWGGGEYDWNSATIIGLFVGFVVSILLFIAWQIRQREAALIPFCLLNDCSVMLSIIFGFLFMGAFVVPVYYLPEWFQIVKGASPMRSGVMLLPSVCSQVFGSAVSGVAAKYVRRYNPWFFIGSGMQCIASGLYSTFKPFSTSSRSWIGFQIIQGLGCGFAAQTALLTVQNVLKSNPSIIPIGISTILFAQYFSSAVMQTAGAAIFHNKLVTALESGAGLNATGIAVLLDAGNLKVKQTALESFPDRVDSIIAAYNEAITTVFYLAVAASATAFVLAAGIPWDNINQPYPSEVTEKQSATASNQPEP